MSRIYPLPIEVEQDINDQILIAADYYSKSNYLSAPGIMNSYEGYRQGCYDTLALVDNEDISLDDISDSVYRLKNESNFRGTTYDRFDRKHALINGYRRGCDFILNKTLAAIRKSRMEET